MTILTSPSSLLDLLQKVQSRIYKNEVNSIDSKVIHSVSLDVFAL